MTPIGKKRVRKPRVIAPVELPQTPEEMEALLDRGRYPGAELESIVQGMRNDLVNGNVAGDVTVINEFRNEMGLSPQAGEEAEAMINPPFDGYIDAMSENESLIEELVGERAAPVVIMDMHRIWHNIFRYLFSKSRNIGGELHLSRPFVRRIQTLLGKKWEDMKQTDKDFILGMMKEMPK